MLLAMPLLLAARHCRRSAPPAEVPPQQAASLLGRWGKARARLARGAAAADRGLAVLLAPQHPLQQLFVIWWLLACERSCLSAVLF